MVRAYDPWSLRGQRASTLVTNEDDLRRVITLAAGGTVKSIVIAVDLTLTDTVIIPSTCAGVRISGAPGVTVRCKTGSAPAFSVAAPYVIFRDLDLKATSSTGTAIFVSSSSFKLLIENVRFLGNEVSSGSTYFGKAVDVADAASVGTRIINCDFMAVVGVTSIGFDTAVLNSRFAGSPALVAASPFCTLAAIPTFIGNKSMNVSATSTIPFSGGRISDNHACSIVVGANVGSLSIVGNSAVVTLDTSAGTGNNRLAGNSGVVTKTLLASDVDDDAPTGLLIRAPQVLLAGTSYAKPAGCKSIVVEIVGGGGGGGGCSSAASSAACGGGGASGAYASKRYDVSALAGPFTYAIGAAGLAGTNAGGNGGNGGDTTFTDGTTLVSAKGGLGGTGEAAGTTAAFVAGGAGQTATNGDLNGAGSPGEYAQRLSGTAGVSGGGGSSEWGGGGLARTTAGAGNAGAGIGGGGGGGLVLSASAAVIGGAGSAGAIRIWEFT